MQWYVTASLACCGGTLVGVLGLLALSSYYVYDGNKNIPTSPGDDWMVHVISLIPITVFFAAAAGYFAWVILSRKRKDLLISVLVCNALCLVVSLYFSITFGIEMGKTNTKADILYDKTLHAIKERFKEKGDSKYVPIWLDNVQNKSKECCGIRTFRDWETLWPEHSNEVPRSCCKEPDNAEKCFYKLDNIPYPATPSNFIKTDTGCVDEINNFLKRNIRVCFIYLLIVSVLFALSEAAYITQYVQDYGTNGRFVEAERTGSRTGTAEDSSSSGIFSFAKGWKKKVKKDEEQAGDLGFDGSGSVQASGFSVSDGTLPGSASQDRQLGSASSSGSDIALDGAALQDGKKKKKRKHRKARRDGTTGAEGGELNRQEVFVVPDSEPPKDDLLAMNGYDAPPVATESNDEVGDSVPENTNPIAAGFSKVGGAVGKIGGALVHGVGKVGGTLVHGAEKAGGAVFHGAAKTTSAVVSGGQAVGGAAITGVEKVGGAVVSGGSAVVGGVGKAGTAVLHGAEATGGAVISGAGKVGGAVVSGGQAVVGGAGKVGGTAVKGTGAVVGGIGRAGGSVVHGLAKLNPFKKSHPAEAPSGSDEEGQAQ